MRPFIRRAKCKTKMAVAKNVKVIGIKGHVYKNAVSKAFCKKYSFDYLRNFPYRNGWRYCPQRIPENERGSLLNMLVRILYE